jgi:hypothetical protein
MPNIAYGESARKNLPNDVLRKNFNYDYPEGLDLKPGSKFHQELLDKILMRARESSNCMVNRFPSWNNIDRVLTTYALTDQDEEDLQEEDSRKPVTIVFPYSFVIMETMLSYLVAAFFQDPLNRYQGVSPEDTMGSDLLQYVIQQQCNRSKVLLPLHTFFRDALSYGFGLSAPGWRVEEGFKTRKRKVSGLFGIGGGFEKFTEEAILYEGNDLSNIDPYKALPDPNVGIHDIQSGEFFGYVEITNSMDLMSEEKVSEDTFNVKYLKFLGDKKTSIYAEDASAREDKFGGRPMRKAHAVTSETDVINMFVKLIPEEWELGDGEYPEKWHFRLAADSIIIGAKPLGLDHNKFPVASIAPDFDGYSTTPISRLEIEYGLQHIVDFLFNSHIQNVRKAVNDMLVVDPYIVNINDLKDPKAGKLIRTRRPVWGKGVKDAVQQLQISDITRANIQDVGWITQYMERIGASSDAMQGHLRTSGPERLTSAEFEGTSRGAVNRMERMARVIGIQGMQDIGYFFASHTQQLMEEETYIKTVGAWPEVLRGIYGNRSRIKVSPYDLLVDYDIVVRDGSIPGGNFSRIWIDLFKVIVEHPELENQFDSVRIFKHIAVNSGAKNVDEFVKVQPMPDEQVLQNAQAGNIIPMTGGA